MDGVINMTDLLWKYREMSEVSSWPLLIEDYYVLVLH
jgi:hypothetical protein